MAKLFLEFSQINGTKSPVRVNTSRWPVDHSRLGTIEFFLPKRCPPEDRRTIFFVWFPLVPRHRWNCSLVSDVSCCGG